MRLILTLLIKNEIEYIESNILFHLSQGVDKIIVTDNGSSDGTLDILAKYKKTGHLEIFQEERNNYNQSAWVTAMARHAYEEHKADWIINSDADEFWMPLQGDLKDYFNSLASASDILVTPRLNFIPSQNPTQPFWEYMTYRQLRPSQKGRVSVRDNGTMYLSDFKSGSKLSMPSSSFGDFFQGYTWPKVAHRGCSEIQVMRGNHTVLSSTLKEETYSRGLEILHFPWFSYDKLKKVVSSFKESLLLNKALENMPWASQVKLMNQGKLLDWYNDLPKIETNADRYVKEGLLEKDDRLSNYMRSLLLGQENSSASVLSNG